MYSSSTPRQPKARLGRQSSAAHLQQVAVRGSALLEDGSPGANAKKAVGRYDGFAGLSQYAIRHNLNRFS